MVVQILVRQMKEDGNELLQVVSYRKETQDLHNAAYIQTTAKDRFFFIRFQSLHETQGNTMKRTNRQLMDTRRVIGYLLPKRLIHNYLCKGMNFWEYGTPTQLEQYVKSISLYHATRKQQQTKKHGNGLCDRRNFKHTSPSDARPQKPS